MQETFDSTGYKLEDRGARWIEGYAFLKPGVTRQQAQAELSSIAQRLENDFPETNRGHGFEFFRSGKRHSTPSEICRPRWRSQPGSRFSFS